MQNEGLSTTNLETAASLQEAFQKLGITKAFWDFDDTFLKTTKHISGRMDLFVRAMVSTYGFQFDKVKQSLDDHNKWTHRVIGVGASRWPAIIKLMEAEYQTPVRSDVASILTGIYSVAPELKEGAIETLELFRAAGLQQVLVTHAVTDWTYQKLETHGLGQYFDAVHIVDVEVQKDAYAWGQAMELAGANPTECLVIGDNIFSDICAGLEAGAGYAIQMKPDWSHLDGDLPIKNASRCNDGLCSLPDLIIEIANNTP